MQWSSQARATEFMMALEAVVEQCRLALEADDRQAEQWLQEIRARLRRESDRRIRREYKRLRRSCKALQKNVKRERRTLLRVKLLIDQPANEQMYNQLKRLHSSKAETPQEVVQHISESLHACMTRTHKQLQSI